MRYFLTLLIMLSLLIPANAGWEPTVKEVTIEEMGLSLEIPGHWTCTPYEELKSDFQLMDQMMLCTPVIIEEDIWGLSIFIYATEREDFKRNVFDMLRERAEDESDVLTIGEELYKILYDADGNEYDSLRTMNIIDETTLVYGVLFHRDGVRYEIYYAPVLPVDFGEYYEKFSDVLDTLRFVE